MSKIIINNKAGLDDDDALQRVAAIIDKGKTARTQDRKHYQYLTAYKDGVEIRSYCRNPGVFTFEITDDL